MNTCLLRFGETDDSSVREKKKSNIAISFSHCSFSFLFLFLYVKLAYSKHRRGDPSTTSPGVNAILQSHYSNLSRPALGATPLA